MEENQSDSPVGSNRRQRAFLRDINGKSDRAVAIIGAALINAHVEQLLTVFFVDDDDEVQALMESDRSLGSLGTRIRVAYLSGLIDVEEKADLEAVSRINAAFTREMEEIGFDDLPIRAWCLDFRLPNKILLTGEKRKPRQLYVFTVALLLRQLAKRIQMAERNRRQVPEKFSLVQIKN